MTVAGRTFLVLLILALAESAGAQSSYSGADQENIPPMNPFQGPYASQGTSSSQYPYSSQGQYPSQNPYQSQGPYPSQTQYPNQVPNSTTDQNNALQDGTDWDSISQDQQTGQPGTMYPNQPNGAYGSYNPNVPNGLANSSTQRNGVDTSVANPPRSTRRTQRLDPPTAFQRMVAETTGRRLPIFGASLFSGDLPTTFAPVHDVTVSPDYVIGPGDELRLQVWGQINQQGSFTVDRTGAISVPQIGTIRVAGQRYDHLNEFLKAQFGRVFRNFNLEVTMGQLRSVQVFVVGQARRPGTYTVSSLSTLVNTLFVSGGPTAQGSLRDIQVKRGATTLVHFDLYDLLLSGDKSKDVVLSPGDVIFIPPVGPQVALLGSVNRPAIYELKKSESKKSDPLNPNTPNKEALNTDGLNQSLLNKDGATATSVSELLDLGGGRTSNAVGSKVRLERIIDRAVLSVVDVDLSKSDQTVLQGGDVVSVLAIVDRFKDAVTLRGNVANPGRYVWHTGMRVSDLIPNKESLVTRNYWEKRNQLGQLPQEFGLLPPNSQTSLQTGMQTQRMDGGSDGLLQTRGQGDQTLYDRATQGGSARATQANGSIGAALAGSSGSFPAKTDVVLSAPDINWSYAVIERQKASDLTTTLIPFSLGKVILDGNQDQNIELLPGDVVTIFSTADLRVPMAQQTRFVRLEGEFVGAGVYSVLPGETLRQLLKRSGGLTQDAYLYASEFTRESTRRVEQQRLNEYADQLEAQVSAESNGLAARSISDRDTAAAAAGAANAQSAIARLRRLQPTGRIVLELKPDSRSAEDVPELALEDGDRFVVPRVPSNINVEGQVYSANAFVFERGRRVKDYLKMAGGPSRQADNRRTFVLRADGSVFSRQYGNLQNAKIFPGDTVVVPLQVNQRAVLRTLVDVATVVGQFGLGIAAINLLK